MKRLFPNSQRSKRMVCVGFLVSVAGIFLSPPFAQAGGVPGLPGWIPLEMEAINLYLAGMNQESSDPQDAVKTLRQARLDSTAAMANGGGANWAVMHNDSLIGQALILAETDAARTPQNTKAAHSPTNVRNNLARPAANRIQVTFKRTVK